MEKSQAEAVAEAILKPNREAQEELRRKRTAAARSLAERRFVAWWVLSGSAVGAVVASLADHRFSNGVLWGGVAGAVSGWAIAGWRRRLAKR